MNGALLVIFNVWDQIVFDREERERPGSQLEEVMEHEPLRIEGARNFVFLLGIVAMIYAAGSGLGSGGEPWPFGVQEALMAALALAAYAATRGAPARGERLQLRPDRRGGACSSPASSSRWRPALLLLNAHAESFGVREPWQFFWAAGALSTFLDNAPTYLTFAATACGLADVPLEGRYLAAVPRARPRGRRRSSRRSPAARSSWAPTPTSATARTSW